MRPQSRGGLDPALLVAAECVVQEHYLDSRKILFATLTRGTLGTDFALGRHPV